MLTLDLSDFMFELQDGTIKHVGAPTAEVTVKLYHASAASAREFGDSQVKLAFADDEGNEVEVALDPDIAVALSDEIDRLREHGIAFE
ncbi:MAG: hypothetical protein ACQETI_08595 [Halobacteriota archaeon]